MARTSTFTPHDATLNAAITSYAGEDCTALRPLWAKESARRRTMLDCLLRLCSEKENASRKASPSDGMRSSASHLAHFYNVVARTPDSQMVDRSTLIESLAASLVSNLSNKVGQVELSSAIEPVHLPGFQWRALILAAHDLVARSLLRTSCGGGGRRIVVSLTTMDAGLAKLAVSDDNDWVEHAFEGDWIASEMANRLASSVVHQRFGCDGRRVEILFPTKRCPAAWPRENDILPPQENLYSEHRLSGSGRTKSHLTCRDLGASPVPFAKEN